MNDEWGKGLEGGFFVYLKVLSPYSPGETEENDKEPQPVNRLRVEPDNA
jgi:hypothetical protein